MTRDDFYLDTVVRLLEQGMDLQAARSHATAILISHWPISAYSQADAAADRLIHEANREWADQ